MAKDLEATKIAASPKKGEPESSPPLSESTVRKTRTVVSTDRLVALGVTLLTVGTAGFYYLPGLIKDDAKGSRLVNAFYCTVMSLSTVGYGDICPANTTALESRVFLVVFLYSGLGIFCGPIMSHASLWRRHMPGGLTALASLTLGVGATIFTSMEGLSQWEAIYASIIAGTTVGYGDYPPTSDWGKLLISVYCIVAIPVFSMLLEPAKDYLEDLCRVETSSLPIKVD